MQGCAAPRSVDFQWLRKNRGHPLKLSISLPLQWVSMISSASMISSGDWRPGTAVAVHALLPPLNCPCPGNHSSLILLVDSCSTLYLRVHQRAPGAVFRMPGSVRGARGNRSPYINLQEMDIGLNDNWLYDHLVDQRSRTIIIRIRSTLPRGIQI